MEDWPEHSPELDPEWKPVSSYSVKQYSKLVHKNTCALSALSLLQSGKFRLRRDSIRVSQTFRLLKLLTETIFCSFVDIVGMLRVWNALKTTELISNHIAMPWKPSKSHVSCWRVSHTVKTGFIILSTHH